MRVIESIEVSGIQRHLKQQKSGVSLNLSSMPGQPEEYKGFRVFLNEDDVDRLVLYWEFQKYTDEQSCKLNRLVDSMESNVRVMRFVNGDPLLGYSPADLRTMPNKELTVVTDDIDGDFLYLIDGNHRTIAQHISGRGFQNVGAFVCVHPKIMEWAYIPNYYKNMKRAS